MNVHTMKRFFNAERTKEDLDLQFPLYEGADSCVTGLGSSSSSDRSFFSPSISASANYSEISASLLKIGATLFSFILFI